MVRLDHNLIKYSLDISVSRFRTGLCSCHPHTDIMCRSPMVTYVEVSHPNTVSMWLGYIYSTFVIIIISELVL